jgi:hypothetical protein
MELGAVLWVGRYCAERRFCCCMLSSVVGSSVVHVLAVGCEAWVGLFSTCGEYKCVF